jgi:predicted Zn finger-like uncharacterized protein
MSELINCPSCKKQLQVPDSQIGERVQCPECGHQFTAAATGMSETPIPPRPSKTPPRDEEDSDIDDRPRRRRRRDEDDDDDYRGNYNVRSDADVPTYMTQAIMVTLCCCWPFGIAAIVNAAKVNTALARGDYEGAVEASEAAKKWCWISAVLGFIVNILYLAVQIAAENRRF